jgi:hypothetical protein
MDHIYLQVCRRRKAKSKKYGMENMTNGVAEKITLIINEKFECKIIHHDRSFIGVYRPPKISLQNICICTIKLGSIQIIFRVSGKTLKQ